jgi:cytochrome P450
MTGNLQHFENVEDVFDPATIQCPFPRYEQVRAAGRAVRVPDERSDVFIVTSYDDCLEVLAKPETFSSKIGPGLRQRPSDAARAVMERGPRIVRTLLTNDPPSHTHFRRLVSRSFTARRMAALEPVVKHIAEELAASMPTGEPTDFVERFAQPLPLRVIARFLGVPDSNLETFRHWSDDAAEVLGGALSEQREIEIATSLVELLQYFEAETGKRRRAPQDDYLTTLVQADNGSLTTEEIVALAYVTLVAGNETTVNMLSATMLLLAHDPQVQRRVREDRSLVPAVVEESLRLHSPVQGFPRLALADTELGDTHIPAGSQVLLLLAAANRDPGKFAAPNEVSLDDRNGPGNIAFGHGIHFCVGAALSRLEGVVAFNVLLDRFSTFELASPDFEPRYGENAMLRTLLSLPLRLGA